MTAERQREDVDALRRRLYRADASQTDLQRYLEERAPEAEPEAPPTEHRRPRRGLALGAVAGALAVCAVTTAVLVHQPTATPKPTGAAPTRPVAAADHSVMIDAGDGRLLPVDPDHLAGPARAAVDIAGRAASAQRFDGLGDQVVPIDLPGADLGDEQAVVVLYSDRTSTISWRALRVVTRRDWFSYQQVVASGRLATFPDHGTPETFGYAGVPPTKVLVEAPPDVHWTLLVAPVSKRTSALH